VAGYIINLGDKRILLYENIELCKFTAQWIQLRSKSPKKSKELFKKIHNIPKQK
jgi:hypothetical protein